MIISDKMKVKLRIKQLTQNRLKNKVKSKPIKQQDNQIYRTLKQMKQTNQNLQEKRQTFQKLIEDIISQKPQIIIKKMSNKNKSKDRIQAQNQIRVSNRLMQKFYNKKNYQQKNYVSLLKNCHNPHFRSISLQNYQTISQKFQQLNKSKPTDNKKQIKNDTQIQNINKIKQENQHKYNSLNKVMQMNNYGENKDIINYRKKLTKLRNYSKKFSLSLQNNKRRYQILDNINQKAQKHFSSLVLNVSDIDLIQNIIQQRVKFSSNNILQNVLIQEDDQVQKWIQKQRMNFMRKQAAQVSANKTIFSNDQRGQTRLNKSLQRSITICSRQKSIKYHSPWVKRMKTQDSEIRKNIVAVNKRHTNQIHKISKTDEFLEVKISNKDINIKNQLLQNKIGQKRSISVYAN